MQLGNLGTFPTSGSFNVSVNLQKIRVLFEIYKIAKELTMMIHAKLSYIYENFVIKELY